MSQAGNITTASSIATSYVTNSGTAEPSGNVLNIVGANGITTSGSGNTVTITGTASLVLQNTSVLTSAQVKSLAAAPVVLVSAPGSGKTIRYLSSQLKLTYGGNNAFTNVQNLVINIGIGTPTTVSTTITGTGFLDQTANTYQEANSISTPPIISATNFESIALVIFNPSGAAITGNAANDNTLTVTTLYQVLTQ